jgi:transcriptional regulator with XRE-family HTH domain
MHLCIYFKKGDNPLINHIGKMIRYYREKRGLSRKDLVDGICDESTLFRIEKANNFPSMYIIDKLCSRLLIPMSLLFEDQYDESEKSLSYLKQRCRKHVYDKEYTELDKDLYNLKTLYDEMNKNDYILYMFILWHKAILLNERNNQPEKAKQLLLPILTSRPVLEIEITMMNTLGLIYISQESNKEAIGYFQQSFIALKNITYLENPTLFVRVGYNYAYCKFYQKEYQQVISLSKQITTFLENHHLLYMKGRTFHMLAKSYEKIGTHPLAKKYMKDAIAIFSVEGKDSYLNKAKTDLLEMQ